MRFVPVSTVAVRALALLVVGVALGVPLVGMLIESFRVTEVVAASGKAYRVAGYVTDAEEGQVRFQVPSETDPDAELTPVQMPKNAIVQRERWSLAHYADVFRSPRTTTLLWNSTVLAAGSALLALLLGLPVGWLVARTTLPGRRVLAALLAGPLLLPPFFAAMGVSDAFGAALSHLGLSGGHLQLANAIVCFAVLLFPVPALLTGRAMAAVPAGAVESARLLAGPRAAFFRVVWPSVLPAALASFTLVFVLALSDFAVPDLLGVFLPKEAVPIHVFATEIFLQFSKYHNVGRAVATGMPFVLATGALLALSAFLVRRCPAEFLGHAARPRPPVALSKPGVALGWTVGGIALSLGLVLPIVGVCMFGFSPLRVPETIRKTEGVLEQADRWLRIGLFSALLSTAVAVVLARWATRGGRAAKTLVAVVGAAPLAVPGMALMVATLEAWVGIPGASGSLWRPVLVLTARFLPYALLASWLALREVDPRLEDAARLLHAGPAARAARIWGPLSRRGWLSAFLLALVFALRELDAIVLIEPGILPVRIYDKVHFGKTGQVADLSMAYLGVLLVPAVLAVWLWGRQTPRRHAEPPGP